MSASELFADLFSGNFRNAFKRLSDWYNGWPQPLKDFVHKLTDDEGQILWAAAQGALGGAIDGKSITEIADIAWEGVKDQVPNKAKTDLLDVLGLLMRSK